MTAAFLSWSLMPLWLIFGAWWNWPADRGRGYRAFAPAGNLLLFVLLFLPGWKAFGFIIQG